MTAAWAPPDPRTRGIPAVVRYPTWAQRAGRYRREVANWCERCERREWPGWWRQFGPKLEVHHCNGRGIVNPLGLEWDAELLTLCEPCHDAITAHHRRLGKQRRQRTGTRAYAATIAEVTEAHMKRRPWLRIGWHRILWGKPERTVGR